MSFPLELLICIWYKIHPRTRKQNNMHPCSFGSPRSNEYSWFFQCIFLHSFKCNGIRRHRLFYSSLTSFLTNANAAKKRRRKTPYVLQNKTGCQHRWDMQAKILPVEGMMYIWCTLGVVYLLVRLAVIKNVVSHRMTLSRAPGAKKLMGMSEKRSWRELISASRRWLYRNNALINYVHVLLLDVDWDWYLQPMLDMSVGSSLNNVCVEFSVLMKMSVYATMLCTYNV